MCPRAHFEQGLVNNFINNPPFGISSAQTARIICTMLPIMNTMKKPHCQRHQVALKKKKRLSYNNI